LTRAEQNGFGKASDGRRLLVRRRMRRMRRRGRRNAYGGIVLKELK